MKTILITGAGGMLAHDLHKSREPWAYTLLCATQQDLDITDISQIETYIQDHDIYTLVNCAAYTAVDLAESEGKRKNFEVNTLAVWLLSKICQKHKIHLIHISTDYVFDGNQKVWYTPHDTPDPLNTYGTAKRLWEELWRQHYPEMIVMRTSRLYGGGLDYKNFVNTMLSLWKKNPKLKVVDDQYGLPTYTKDLCGYIYHIIQHIDVYIGKTIHATNTWEAITWHTFAKKIFEVWGNVYTDLIVEPCTTEQYPTPARRPSYSMLISDDTWYEMPIWDDGLRRYIQTMI